MKTSLVEHDSLSGEQRPIQTVRLQGDGWHLEVMVAADGNGIHIRSAGAQSPSIIVRPQAGNIVEVTTDVAQKERHIANEWADMATNGIQWLRNIQDGISVPEEALKEMESNLARIRQL